MGTGPSEGTNEHGVFAGAAGIPDDLSPLGKQKRKPHGMDFCGIIRFVLERAKSTAEALKSFARSQSPTIWRWSQDGKTTLNCSFYRRSNWPCRELGRTEELFCSPPSVGRLPYHQLPPSRPPTATVIPSSRKEWPTLGSVLRDEASEKSQQPSRFGRVYDLKRLTMELCIDLDFEFKFRFDFKER